MTGERVLSFEGGRNFRDMGGYPTRDGRRLKWRRLYRSGSMAALTPADYDRLARLGVRAVVDLRTTYERQAYPTDWARIPDLSYWARDHDASFGDLRALFASEAPTPGAGRAAMVAIYRELPFEQAPAYRELFRRLAGGETPLIFNCSAGKDRTGVAACLVLSALGVDSETILEDYLLTNTAYDHRTVGGDPWSLAARLPPEMVDAVMSVEAAYLQAALEAIEAAHGSVGGYLGEALGVTEPMLQQLQAHLME